MAESMDVLPAEVTESIQITTEATDAVAKFRAGVVKFFTQASVLERDAAEALARMKQRTLPQSAEEDEALQLAIKAANRQKKAIEDHWGITAVFHKMHRWTVACRERGVKLLDETSTIGNRLHGGYVAAAELAARLEQDRLRAEAEASAQRVRQAELERLEELALLAEYSEDVLSDREVAFVAAIVAGETDWTEAAKRAGYKDPEAQGPRLMRTEKIAVAIKARHEALALRRQATAVQAQPLTVNVVTVQPNVVKAAGTQERTTYSAEVFDLERWRVGVLTGAIPSDTMMPNPAVLNGYARSLKTLIDRWPGVRVVASTKVV